MSSRGAYLPALILFRAQVVYLEYDVLDQADSSGSDSADYGDDEEE